MNGQILERTKMASNAVNEPGHGQAATAPGKPDDQLLGMATLMTRVFNGVDLHPLAATLIERIERNPEDANALMDLSTVLHLHHKPDIARTVQAEALSVRPDYRLAPADEDASATGLRVLALMAPGDLSANTPMEFLLADSDITLEMLYVQPNRPLPAVLPLHDVVFVAAAESDESLSLLKCLGRMVRHLDAPVLNAPENIEWMSRDGAYEKLHTTEGVVMAKTWRVSRARLEAAALTDDDLRKVSSRAAYPVIVRPVGSHAGRALVRCETSADLRAYLAGDSGLELSDCEFFVAPFIDYRDDDGLYRKYRVVLIEGRAFACHMAISGHWMIHYLNADMADSAAKRVEEACFMKDFDRDFGARHASAFSEINARLGLDYLGFDCAETRDGRLLIFEVDTSMVVHAMDSPEIFPYKRPQMQKIFNAFRAMLKRAAEGNGW